MAKLSRLIKGQNIAFDTHQQGDAQQTRWKNIHLEKRLHEGGKIRFPLYNGKPRRTPKVNEKTYQRVIKEVSNTLKRDSNLTDILAHTIADQLHRFSSGAATIAHAQEAAQNIASYFDLDKEFEVAVARYAGKKLIEYTSHHRSRDDGRMIEIKQSSIEISLRSAPSVYRKVLRKKK